MVNDLARKARGAFFTPAELTSFVADWAIRSPRDTVLEPSCGEAAFLLAAAERIAALGGSADGKQLHGTDIHGPSALTARGLLATAGIRANIVVGDFFDRDPVGTFDAVVGNPPYIRYQDFSGASRAKAQAAALASGVRIGGLASSWAAFTVHAARFLKPGGRLGLVLPAELLHVNYAAPIRRFLLERFARVTLVMFERLVFPDVLTEVVLLLAEGDGPSEFIHVAQLHDLSDLAGLDTGQGFGRGWRPKAREDKWVSALLPDNAAAVYGNVVAGGAFEPLAAWGAVSLGAVTGDNSYFTLSRDDLVRLGLTADDVVRLSPPGSRHIRGVSFSEQAYKEQVRLGRQTYLFRAESTPSTAAGRYIADGEARGINLAYKCRVRSPWWKVPLPAVPDLFLTYMNHDLPRLVSNSARVQYLNSLHGVVLHSRRKGLGTEFLPIGSLNSLSALGAELGGRSYGGGILKIEPREAARLPVPSRESLKEASAALKALKPQVGALLRAGNLTEVVKLVDDVLLVRSLAISRQQVGELQKARFVLRERRRERSMSQ